MDYLGNRTGPAPDGNCHSTLNEDGSFNTDAASARPGGAQPINIYGSTTVSGNAQLHQGDTYNVSYTNSYNSYQGPSLLNPQENINLQRLVESAVLTALSSSAASGYSAHRGIPRRSSRQPYSSYASRLSAVDSHDDGYDDEELRARFDNVDELGFEDAFDEHVQLLRDTPRRGTPGIWSPNDGTKTPRPRFPLPASTFGENFSSMHSMTDRVATHRSDFIPEHIAHVHTLPSAPKINPPPLQSDYHTTCPTEEPFAQAGAQFITHNPDCHPKPDLTHPNTPDSIGHLSRWLLYGTPWHHSSTFIDNKTTTPYIDAKSMAIGLSAARVAGQITLANLTGEIPGSHVVSLLIDTWQWHPLMAGQEQDNAVRHVCNLTAHLERLELVEKLGEVEDVRRGRSNGEGTHGTAMAFNTGLRGS